jgi:natural product biosynthesis luciferase-like monooxygenase protein
MNCYLFGSNSLTIECASTLLRHGHRIEGVVTADSAIVKWANSHAVPAFTPNTGLAQTLGQSPFDLLFSVAYLSIIPEAILSLPRVAAINFHDGPLPEYAGLNTPAWALMNEESRYGISWHLMTGRLDAGGILLKRTFDVQPDETSLSLNLKCYQAAIESFDDLIQALEERRLAPQKQDLSARKYFAKDRRPEAACILSWHKDAETISAMVRALEFGAYENPLGLPKLAIGSDAVIVKGVEIGETSSGAPPGTIVRAEQSVLQIATGSRDIMIQGLLRPEGTPIPILSFLEKCALTTGDSLPCLSPPSADRLTTLNTAICRKEAYWLDRLTHVSLVETPYAKPSSQPEKSRFDTLDMALPAAFMSWACEAHEATDRVSLLAAAFAAYLARLTGQTEFDLAFRDRELKRQLQDCESVFSSHVPVRFSCVPSQSFREFLPGALEALHDARRNLSFSRDIVLRYPQLTSLQGAGLVAGLQIVLEVADSFVDHVALEGSTLTVLLSPNDDLVRWTFDAKSLAHDDVRLMQDQFTLFLEAITDSSRAICQLDILGSTQRQKLLVEWNATETSLATTECIHQLIEAQVARTPDAIALAFEDSLLTYKELDARANRLAHYLQKNGLQRDGFAGTYLKRSLDMVIAVLATLKAGGAYLPLDPEFPRDRIRFMLEDTDTTLIVTTSDLAQNLDWNRGKIVLLDDDTDVVSRESEERPTSGVSPENLAYVIYTSGSTGRPKGVLVEHRNVGNLFAGMDAKISHDPPGVWLAVTSLSFDISVLEILWTLARGFKVVLYSEMAHRRPQTPATASWRPADRQVDLSLFYFASDEGECSEHKYRLLLEGAKFADENDLTALWVPERHFYAFGGLYPNPSVAAAAVAAVTKRIGIRAGSCVLPLHSPIRVAEEWSLVDNLSGGRVGVSFASGWQPHDFVLKPENFAGRQKLLFERIEVVRKLWRGEAVAFTDGRGEEVAIRILPRPVQRELPVWITAAGNPETCKRAGENGFNLLTHLLGQSVDELAAKIVIYRESLAAGPARSSRGHVSLMLHTFLGESRDKVREQVRGPMKSYLRSAVGLIEKAAWSFPTFKHATTNKDGGFSVDHLSEDELDAVLDFAFERYFETSGLFGTPKECSEMLERLRGIGVDEVACLIDFGVPTSEVLDHLSYLKELRQLHSERAAPTPDYSIPALIADHKVTHLQCTPSMITLLLAEQPARAALGTLLQLLIGGEAFPLALANELKRILPGEILNMYGPTETTVWSSVHPVNGEVDSIPIGKPIANTRFYVLDEHLQPVPVGLVGELFIGGEGVVRGYHNRPNLTAERFLSDPFANVPHARIYRTGDLVRYRIDGSVEILGRADHQVKIRGYRIELGEIESVLEKHPEVREAVVVVYEELAGSKRLVAYVKLRGDTVPSLTSMRQFLGDRLPDYMIPSHVVRVDAFPLTPNKKIDRKALPPPDRAFQLETLREVEAVVPPSNELEESLRGIWMEVLQLSRVGVEDNFFDLGGHSLLAVQAHRLIRGRLEQDVALTDLFRFPTIRSLARHLGGTRIDSELNAAARRIATRKNSIPRRRRAASTQEMTGDR